MTYIQSSETVQMASKSPEETFRIGKSLASSLIRNGVTLRLSGELGAGKTLFVRGLAAGLGLNDAITSPTYALENRYGETLLHVDLFRINPKEAEQIVTASEDFPGVRAIEWSERAEKVVLQQPHNISVDIQETSPTTRDITITFDDLPFPDRKTIESWRKEVRLPAHIQTHCDKVGEFSKICANAILARSIVARPHAVRVAGEVHDLLRFVDFRSQGAHLPLADDDLKAFWKKTASQYAKTHEEAAATFLTKHGYKELAEIIRPHGLHALNAPNPFRTTEQKILFYADKRVLGDRVVSLDERFDDFAIRYGGGVELTEAKEWRRKTKELEKELFGEITPR